MYEGIDDRLERAARGMRIADLPREALIDRLSGILSGTYILRQWKSCQYVISTD